MRWRMQSSKLRYCHMKSLNKTEILISALCMFFDSKCKIRSKGLIYTFNSLFEEASISLSLCLSFFFFFFFFFFLF